MIDYLCQRAKSLSSIVLRFYSWNVIRMKENKKSVSWLISKYIIINSRPWQHHGFLFPLQFFNTWICLHIQLVLRQQLQSCLLEDVSLKNEIVIMAGKQTDRCSSECGWIFEYFNLAGMVKIFF